MRGVVGGLRTSRGMGALVIKRIFKQRIVAICDQITYASSAYVDLKSTANAMSDTLIDFSREPRTAADHQIARVVELVLPAAVDEARKVRIGGDGDGGYVMFEDLRCDGAVSVGVGPDVSWDRDIAERGIPVVMFDHTVRRLPDDVPGGVFHRVGVGNGDRLQSLPKLIEMAGFSGSNNLMLNIDVEGAEWDVLNTVDSQCLLRFRQIVCELHGFDEIDGGALGDRIVNALERLSETHVPIHLHANNYARIARFGDLWFPAAIEVSWVRRELLPQTSPTDRIRSSHDRPNDPRVCEIQLEGILRKPTG
jgi:hypothetical protein